MWRTPFPSRAVSRVQGPKKGISAGFIDMRSFIKGLLTVGFVLGVRLWTMARAFVSNLETIMVW